MSPSRDPLGSLSANCLPTYSPTPHAKPVYPIFLTRKAVASRCHPSDVASASVLGKTSCDEQKHRTDRKRVKTSCSHPADDKSFDRIDGSRRFSIPDYFNPRTSIRASCAPPILKAEPEKQGNAVWKRRRGRLGCGLSSQADRPQPASMLQSLVTRLGSDPQEPPSTMMLPSVDSPLGRHREFDPALVLAFSDSAKLYSASEAYDSNQKRLLAIGGEEGGIRIVDVDHFAASANSATDYWWRAHDNGVFDLKWTNSDTRLLSASADQSLRVFDLGSGTPRALVTMTGHTSTIKSTAILDSGHLGSGAETNLIASGGRDGNINVYDLRCPGRSDGVRRSRRMRSTSSIECSGGQTIEPVLTLRQPHNAPSGRRSSSDARSSSRTITSLVSLQTMPGILASGGTFDGVVKLWDIRVPSSGSNSRAKCTPYAVLPDPTMAGDNPSRRPRSVNALCENPTTGDLYTLCADSQVHVLRPAGARGSCDQAEAIMPQKYVHPDLLMRSFYIRMSLSPDGRYLACGSSHAGVMTWDTMSGTHNRPRVQAVRFSLPMTASSTTPEVIAVDWAKDILAASSDDSRTRLWRPHLEMSQRLRDADESVRAEWSGMQ